MNKIIIILLVFIPHLAFSQLNQNLIQYNQTINKDSLEKTVLKLQSYGTRFVFKPNRKAIAESLREQLQSYGFQTKLDSFYIQDFEYPRRSGILNNSWQYNVVGEKIGQYAPDTFLVIGAHYDAISFYQDKTPNFDTTPGADDNASGVAAIMEIARLYHLHNIIPTKTLRIELYAAEEIGLMGSNAAIQRSSDMLTEHIAGMICLDMIANKTDTTQPDVVKLIEYENSQELTQFCEQTALSYTNLIPIRTFELNYASDSYSYNSWGRRAIFIHEDQFHPFYHSAQDLSSSLNYDYFAKLTQLAFSITYLATKTNEYYPISIPQNPSLTESQIHLLENPAKDKIRFTYNSPRPENPIVELINRMGQVEKTYNLSVYKFSSQEYHIPTQDLRAGIYILKIGNQTKKLVVIK
ncbi:MAG: M28 family peptidase [Bacteroidales bacterium]